MSCTPNPYRTQVPRRLVLGAQRQADGAVRHPRDRAVQRRHQCASCCRQRGRATRPQTPPSPAPSLLASTLHAVRVLLPESEADWLSTQRSRPLQILGGMRRTLHRQNKLGNLSNHLHKKLEEDMRELDLVVGGCAPPLPLLLSPAARAVRQPIACTSMPSLWSPGPYPNAGASACSRRRCRRRCLGTSCAA